MNRYLIIIFIFFSSQTFAQNSGVTKPVKYHHKLVKSCKAEIDSLTHKLVYITADIPAENAGGEDVLTQQLRRKVILEHVNIFADHDTKIIVAFIVDANGNIKGERIVRDKTNTVGRQMLAIVNTLKWTPAKCGNKNVAMLYKLPLNIDFTED